MGPTQLDDELLRSPFEYSLQLPSDSASSPSSSVPVSGSYEGYFMMKPPHQAPYKVEEKAVTLSFTPSSTGGGGGDEEGQGQPKTYNVVGSGKNKFGTFDLTGALDCTTGVLNLNKSYRVIAGAVKRSRSKSSKRKSASSSLAGGAKPKRLKSSSSSGSSVTAGVPMRRQSSQRERKRTKRTIESDGGIDVGGGGRLPPLMQALLKKVTALSKMQDAYWLCKKVEASEVPDYYTIIKHPMYFNKVIERIQSGFYLLENLPPPVAGEAPRFGQPGGPAICPFGPRAYAAIRQREAAAAAAAAGAAAAAAATGAVVAMTSGESLGAAPAFDNKAVEAAAATAATSGTKTEAETSAEKDARMRLLDPDWDYTKTVLDIGTLPHDATQGGGHQGVWRDVGQIFANVYLYNDAKDVLGLRAQAKRLRARWEAAYAKILANEEQRKRRLELKSASTSAAGKGAASGGGGGSVGHPPSGSPLSSARYGSSPGSGSGKGGKGKRVRKPSKKYDDGDYQDAGALDDEDRDSDYGSGNKRRKKKGSSSSSSRDRSRKSKGKKKKKRRRRSYSDSEDSDSDSSSDSDSQSLAKSRAMNEMKLMRKKMKKMQREMERMKKKAKASKKRDRGSHHGSGGADAYGDYGVGAGVDLNSSASSGHRRGGAAAGDAMTYEEKKKLSEDIHLLPEDKLNKVVTIIYEGRDFPDDDEVEINLEELSQAKLKELQIYVNKSLKQTRKYKVRKAGGNATQQQRMDTVREATQMRLNEIDSELTAMSKHRSASGRGSDDDDDVEDDDEQTSKELGAEMEGMGMSLNDASQPLIAPKEAASAGGSSGGAEGAGAGSQQPTSDMVNSANLDAWSNLASLGGMDGAGAGVLAAAAHPATDPNSTAAKTWNEVQKQTQTQQQRARERAAQEEEARRRRKELDRQQREAAAAARREVATAAASENDSEAEKARKLLEQRAAAREEREKMGRTVDMDAQRYAMSTFERGGI